MANKEDSSPEKSKHTCSENTSTRTYFNKPHPRTNHSSRCLITPQRGNSHDLTKTNPKPRPNDSRANVSIVGNKDIENRNAEDDNEMRLMEQPSQTPYNQPNDRKTINKNTTQISFARFADTLGIQLEIAENEFPNKRAPHLDNSHTNKLITRKTKNGDMN